MTTELQPLELQPALLDLVEPIERAKTAIQNGGENLARFLIRARGLARHGEWLPFLERVGVPERTAQRLMRWVTLLDSGQVDRGRSMTALLEDAREPKSDTMTDLPESTEERFRRYYLNTADAVCEFRSKVVEARDVLPIPEDEHSNLIQSLPQDGPLSLMAWTEWVLDLHEAGYFDHDGHNDEAWAKAWDTRPWQPGYIQRMIDEARP